MKDYAELISLFIFSMIGVALVVWAESGNSESLPQEEPQIMVLGVDGEKYLACQAKVDLSLFNTDLAYKLGIWSAACRAAIDGKTNAGN